MTLVVLWTTSNHKAKVSTRAGSDCAPALMLADLCVCKGSRNLHRFIYRLTTVIIVAASKLNRHLYRLGPPKLKCDKINSPCYGTHCLVMWFIGIVMSQWRILYAIILSVLSVHYTGV